ncbi:MAG: hypothetical protein U0641_09365 [Anaerolineae bacterium]
MFRCLHHRLFVAIVLLLVSLPIGISSASVEATAAGAPLVSWNCFYLTCRTLHAATLTATDGWAVGDNGTILRWRGGAWAASPSPTDLDLYGVSFLRPDSGWAVGGHGGDRVGLHWDGATWTSIPFWPTDEMPPGGPNAPRAVSAWSDSNAWMVGERGVLFYLLDGRWLWDGRIVDDDLNAVDMVGPNEAWAVGGRNDGGHATSSAAAHLSNGAWLPVTMPTTRAGYQVNLLGMDFVDPANGWAVGEYYDPAIQDLRGAVLRYGAGTWRVESEDIAASLFSVKMISRDSGWALGWRYGAGGPLAVYLQYKSGAWMPVAGPASFAPLSVALSSETSGWAVGVSGALLELANGAWVPRTILTSDNLNSVAFNASGGWAVGYNGTIARFQGGNWALLTSPTRNTLNAVALGEDQGWAVGNGGVILHLTDGEWSSVASPSSFSLRGVALTSATEGWAVGNHGVLLALRGGAWSAMPTVVGAPLSAVALSGSDGWAVGETDADTGRAAILRLQDGTWSSVPSPATQSLNAVATDGVTAWAVGNRGVILHYASGTWQEAPSPTTEILLGVTMTSANTALAVGANGALLEYSSGAWHILPPLGWQILRSVARDTAGGVWAVGGYGVILKGYGVTPRAYLPLLARSDGRASPAP